MSILFRQKALEDWASLGKAAREFLKQKNNCERNDSTLTGREIEKMIDYLKKNHYPEQFRSFGWGEYYVLPPVPGDISTMKTLPKDEAGQPILKYAQLILPDGTFAIERYWIDSHGIWWRQAKPFRADTQY
jgi:hypothetical protein